MDRHTKGGQVEIHTYTESHCCVIVAKGSINARTPTGMNRLENIRGKVDYFIFDLEFIGQIQDLHTCRIWEISVFSKCTNSWFTRVVDPDPAIAVFPRPPVPELPQLTRTFLKNQSAQTWAVVLVDLIAWVTQNTNKIPVFISHNTFKADKPILELEAARYNLTLPLHWYFFDSLHFCREVVHSSSGNFSLSGLHLELFNTPIQSAHRAKYDVIACTNILRSITNGQWLLYGPVYSTYTTSLRSINWVGKRAEEVLGEHNVHSVEMLLFVLKGNALNDYTTHSLTSQQSIEKSIRNMLSVIPLGNVQHIIAAVHQLFRPRLLVTAVV